MTFSPDQYEYDESRFITQSDVNDITEAAKIAAANECGYDPNRVSDFVRACIGTRTVVHSIAEAVARSREG